MGYYAGGYGHECGIVVCRACGWRGGGGLCVGVRVEGDVECDVGGCALRIRLDTLVGIIGSIGVVALLWAFFAFGGGWKASWLPVGVIEGPEGSCAVVWLIPERRK